MWLIWCVFYNFHPKSFLQTQKGITSYRKNIWIISNNIIKLTANLQERSAEKFHMKYTLSFYVYNWFTALLNINTHTKFAEIYERQK